MKTPRTPRVRDNATPSIHDDPAFREARSRLGVAAKAEKQHERQRRAADELGPLNTPADALARLETIGRLAIGGIIAGTQANAAVQACRVWLEVERLALTLARVKESERRIAELTRELAQARAERN